MVIDVPEFVGGARRAAFAREKNPRADRIGRGNRRSHRQGVLADPAFTGRGTPTRQAVSTARAIVEEGGDSWFFLTADYAFGHAMERDVAERGQRIGRQGGGAGQASVEHLGLLARS